MTKMCGGRAPPKFSNLASRAPGRAPPKFANFGGSHYGARPGIVFIVSELSSQAGVTALPGLGNTVGRGVCPLGALNLM